jgi:hypothetical protein
VTAPAPQTGDRCEWCGTRIPAFRDSFLAYQWRNGHAGVCALMVERFGDPAAIESERFGAATR